MSKKKLCKLLKKLTPTEFKQLGNYSKSPYYGSKTENVENYYKILKNQNPNFDIDKLKTTKAFKSMNIGSFHNLTTKMIRIVEDYYLQITNDKDGLKRKQQLAIIYEQRNIYNLSHTYAKTLLEELAKDPIQNTSTYLNRYLLNRGLYSSLGTSLEEDKGNYLKETYRYLNHFFLLEEKRLEADYINRENIFGKNKEAYFYKSDFIEPTENKTYQLCKKVLKLLNEGNNEDFLEIQQFIKEFEKEISREDRIDMLLISINYVLKELTNGNKNLGKELIGLYQFGLNSKLFFINGLLPYKTFLNMVIMGSGLKQLAWAKKIINEYHQYLSEHQKEEYLFLANAFYFFHKGDFEKVISIEQEINFTDLLLSITTKVLVLRAYYELYSKDDNYNQLGLNYSLAFDKFLKRNKDKLEELKLLAYKNFSAFYKKLIKHQPIQPISQKELKKLKENIEGYEVVAVKIWLQDKLNLLKK